ncbi:YbdK family carboxylate-amine ligase [Spirillospora sp. NPDC052269]
MDTSADTAAGTSAVAPEPGMTMGVEEEFLLLDAETLQPVPRASAVLRRACAETEGPCALLGEMWKSQVESTTGICTGLDELRDHLVSGRSRLANAARAEGTRIASVGLPVTPSPEPVSSDDPHHLDCLDRFTPVVSGPEFCATHIHIGMPDRDVGVAVLNLVTPWLPVLLAVTANSPYLHGTDTRFHSWRHQVYTRLPCSGPPPWYASSAEYDAEYDRMVEAGLWTAGTGSLHTVRLSSRYPTLEVRVGDACATVDDAVLYAALARGLVRTALTDLRHGRTCPTTALAAHATTSAGLWASARHGLTRALDPRTGRPLDGPGMIAALLRHVTPALDDLGDTVRVRALLRDLLMRGNGADRQRRTRPGPDAATALDTVLTETLRGVEDPLACDA